MIPQGFTESVVEDAAIAWLESLGYAVLHGPDIVPDETRMKNTERLAKEAV